MDVGAGKLEEPKKNEKARLATFKKRKNSLMKKAYELSTLCGVEVCIIIYAPPQLRGQSVKPPETWTSEEADLISIITRYQKKISVGGGGTSSSSNFHGNKVGQEGENGAGVGSSNQYKFRDQIRSYVRNFTTWDPRMDSLSEDQLKVILVTMEKKLKVIADRKLNNNTIKRSNPVVVVE